MTVTISGQPATAGAGPDQIWCNATIFQLNATPNPVPLGKAPGDGELKGLDRALLGSRGEARRRSQGFE